MPANIKITSTNQAPSQTHMSLYMMMMPKLERQVNTFTWILALYEEMNSGSNKNMDPLS